MNIEDTLQMGISAHKLGKIYEAERYYTAILKVEPEHPHANHNMGVLAASAGKPIKALPLFKRALTANPNIAQFWLSYIEALLKAGNLQDAKELFADAKRNGAKGDGFDKLEKKLNLSSRQAQQLEYKISKVEQKYSNILDNVTIHQALNIAKKN